MDNVIKILQFLKDNNGQCTYGEFRSFDSGPQHLAAVLEHELVPSGYVIDERRSQTYRLTVEGRDHLKDILSVNTPPQDPEES